MHRLLIALALAGTAPTLAAAAPNCECFCASTEAQCIRYRLPDGGYGCNYAYPPLMRGDDLGYTAGFFPDATDGGQCAALNGSACEGYADPVIGNSGALVPGAYYDCVWGYNRR